MKFIEAMMKKNILISFLFLIVLVPACPNPDNLNPPQPPKPTPVPTGSEYCKLADMHLYDMCQADSNKNKYCCEVGAKTKKGKTYTEFCIEKQNQGVFLNPKCLSTITSCNQIDACTNSN